MKQYLTLLCILHTDIFILFILFFSLISWSIALNPFHDILMDHHSQFKKTLLLIKPVNVTFEMRLQRNFEDLCRPVHQSQVPANLIMPSLSNYSPARRRRKRKLKAYPSGSPSEWPLLKCSLARTWPWEWWEKKRSNPFNWIKCAIREFLAIYPENKRF